MERQSSFLASLLEEERRQFIKEQQAKAHKEKGARDIRVKDIFKSDSRRNSMTKEKLEKEMKTRKNSKKNIMNQLATALKKASENEPDDEKDAGEEENAKEANREKITKTMQPNHEIMGEPGSHESSSSEDEGTSVAKRDDVCCNSCI